MILIYSDTISNRLQYTLDVLFQHVLKTEYQLVDLNTFVSDTTSPKINYSTQKLENCIAITPHTLLFENDVKPQKITVEWDNNIPYFFDKDVFASTFFMVSRYEEYLPSELDAHHRFQAENSIAFQHHFLKFPVVNWWALELKTALLELNSSKSAAPKTVLFLPTKYTFINSLDIDIAYAYKGKGGLRLISSTAKAILTLNVADLKNRWNYCIKKQTDPYNVYQKIDALKEKYKATTVYFFLLGNYGTYDKNLPHHSKPYRKLIHKISTQNTVGIHPSYFSNTSQNQLQTEIDRLDEITQQPTTKSRQHFLKLSLPDTYENLIACGISEDYTMGYASQVGFRAGICCPYPFFNLLTNEVRHLTLVPFQVMDGTLNEYLALSPTAAIDTLQKMIAAVKEVNGTFVSLWHNSSLSECEQWKGWSEVYEALLHCASEKEA